MTDTTRDNELQPFEEVLASLPEETPPADLEHRILGALRTEERRARQAAPSSWRIALRVLLPAAAAFAVIVAVLPGLLGPGEDEGYMPELLTADPIPASPNMRSAFDARAAEPVSRLRAEAAADRALAHREAVPTAKAAPMGRDEWEYSLGDYVDLERGGAVYAEDAVDSLLPPADDEKAAWRVKDAPEQPWRDESGQRQLITRKALNVEVEDVEEAHDRAQRIIERAEGTVVSESLEIRERERSLARMSARLPLNQIDGVISQLRDLGRTLRLTSDGIDRTRDYYTQGTEIRGLGSEEDRLVEQYEAEANPTRKRQLYDQIMALRDKAAGRKERLWDLSDQTHSVLLDLLLLERSGPLEFLPRAFVQMGRGALWVIVTAVFWLPVLVVTFLAVRRAERRSAPPAA